MADRVKLDVASRAAASEFHEKIEPLGPARMTDKSDLDLSRRAGGLATDDLTVLRGEEMKSGRFAAAALAAGFPA